MATITHAGPKHRESEFVWMPNLGIRLTGSCGPNASASALWAALNRPVHTADVYTLMRHYGWCDPNGASTLVGLNAAIRQMGATVNDWVDWQASWSGWLGFFKLWLGRQSAIVMETNNGQALVDAVTGLGENASGLVHHFIAVHAYHTGGPCALLGGRVLPEGFVCADGDNLAGGNYRPYFNAADTLQFYTLATMQAAQVAGAIAVAVPGNVQGVLMAWQQQSDGSGKDAHGHTCGGGVMGYLAQNGLAGSDGLLSETFYGGNDSFLPLSDGHIVTAHHNGSQWTVDESGAQALVSVWQALVAERADDASKAQAVAALNTQLGDANATIKQLQAQIAQLEASQSDPQAQAAKALMTQLKATLAQF